MKTYTSSVPRERALLTLLATILSGLLGECLGFMFGLLCLPHAGVSHPTLWVLGWTVMGSLQGACVLPASSLGRGDGLRGFAACLVSAGCLFTSLCALLMWIAMGRGSELSLLMATGLSLICTPPICTYLFSRRELNVSFPVSI